MEILDASEPAHAADGPKKHRQRARPPRRTSNANDINSHFAGRPFGPLNRLALPCRSGIFHTMRKLNLTIREASLSKKGRGRLSETERIAA
jgi:hypothetical protein